MLRRNRLVGRVIPVIPGPLSAKGTDAALPEPGRVFRGDFLLSTGLSLWEFYSPVNPGRFIQVQVPLVILFGTIIVLTIIGMVNGPLLQTYGEHDGFSIARGIVIMIDSFVALTVCIELLRPEIDDQPFPIEAPGALTWPGGSWSGTIRSMSMNQLTFEIAAARAGLRQRAEAGGELPRRTAVPRRGDRDRTKAHDPSARRPCRHPQRDDRPPLLRSAAKHRRHRAHAADPASPHLRVAASGTGACPRDSHYSQLTSPYLVGIGRDVWCAAFITLLLVPAKLSGTGIYIALYICL